jgi:type VI secretion system protein VasJ
MFASTELRETDVMTYSDQLLTHYLSLAARPVPEQSFMGEEIRFTAEFEALEREVGKTRSMHESGPVDWPRVRQGCEAILQDLSKDLRVVCWLSWALYETESFAGLLAGCGVIDHLCQRQWDSFTPRKARTRCAALAWFVARIDKVLVEDVSVKDQLPLFEKLEDCLRGIDETFTGNLKDEAPLLLPLRRRLTRMMLKAREAESKPATVVAQIKQVAANLFAPVVKIDNEKDARSAWKAQQESALPLCAWWLRNKACDLRALRLNRAINWLEIDRLPECNSERITALRGIPADRLKNYDDRFQQGHYADLIVDLEASLAGAPFWLDGQYRVWMCLKALNADAAMSEVETCLSTFLSRFPGLAELRFEDGRPFADAATKSWITGHVVAQPQVDREPEKVEGESLRPAWEVVMDEMIPLLETESVKPVAQVFREHIRKAQGNREKFYWRLTLARLCHKAKKYELARNQLEVLHEQMKAAGLADWEPDLYLDVLRLLYSCCELLPQNKVVREYKEELYGRLCHLDIESVLQ